MCKFWRHLLIRGCGQSFCCAPLHFYPSSLPVTAATPLLSCVQQVHVRPPAVWLAPSSLPCLPILPPGCTPHISNYNLLSNIYLLSINYPAVWLCSSHSTLPCVRSSSMRFALLCAFLFMLFCSFQELFYAFLFFSGALPCFFVLFRSSSMLLVTQPCDHSSDHHQAPHPD